MISRLIVTMFIAAGFATSASAASLIPPPTLDPAIKDTAADTVLIGGDVIVESFAPVLVSSRPLASQTPAFASIVGFPGFYELTVEDDVGNVLLQGDAFRVASSNDGTFQMLFAATPATADFFGDWILAIVGAPFAGDPLGSSAFFVGQGDLTITTPVPVIATLPFAITGLGALLLFTRRRRGHRPVRDAQGTQPTLASNQPGIPATICRAGQRTA